MLGETLQNNDVYIFFENDEIERLGYEKIKGIYVNFQDPSRICPLEASVNDEIEDEIKTSGKKDEEGFFPWFHIKLNKRKHEILVERRTCGIHEGFRHIDLLDASNIENLNPGIRFAYRQLKHYRSKYSLEET
ncbi:MAG: hypothetical protein ACOCUU_01120 [Nanoarchaeota archaeon]